MSNPCTAYGPSFAKLPGTDTCVKVGGAASIEAGSSLRR
nr:MULTISPECIES: porin [unclassified Bradyrhizobium]